VTDAQDLILDRLVGAKLGVNLPDSPLRVAAELFEGKRPIKFTQRYNDSVMSEIARRLGFPVILAEAIQGGVKAMKDEEDRRRFAMTVFRVLPVGGPQTKLSKLEMAQVAAATAADVHSIVCTDPKCEWAEVMLKLAHSDPATDPSILNAPRRCLTTDAEFPYGFTGILYPNSPNTARLVTLGQHVWTAFENKPKTTAGYALRECVRLTITERGIPEAVALVAAIARRCGMATEAV
jgi:hypothetical protein